MNQRDSKEAILPVPIGSCPYWLLTAQEAAEKWNVSLRWVQRLCKGNRIEGVMNINRVWLIPKNAEKPADARKKLMKN